MSFFNTMNGVNAARSAQSPQVQRMGMGGTQPSGPPLPVSGQQGMGTVQQRIGRPMSMSETPAPTGSSYTRGAGMGGHLSKPKLSDDDLQGATYQGVVPGAPPPSAASVVGAMPSGPTYDPNDPANSALAGYSMAR